MANLFDTLRIGGNALSAQQVAAQVVGNNLSGASIDGYHRQDVTFIGQSGLGGIRDVQVNRAVSHYLDVQINGQVSEYAFENERAQQLGIIMSAIGRLEEGGISEGISNFFGSWRNVNVAPADITTRRDLLAQADVLCSRFNQAAQNLTSAQNLADADLLLNLSTINDALDLVANLNSAVTAAAAAGEPSNALADQRDQAVEQLANLVGATTSIDDEGRYTVTLSGISVVSSSASYHLVAVPGASSGAGLHQVLVDGTTQGDISGSIRGGLVGAKLATRDDDIPATLAELDQLAFDFASAVNSLHKLGFGLDGSTGNDLFDVGTVAAGTSAEIAVAAAMVDQPTTIAAATDPTSVYGDSSNALAIINLESSLICTSNSETPAAATARLVAHSGENVALAESKRDVAESHLLQIKTLSEQQIGVSINEQLMQLTRIEHAFQASAKLVAVVERMLEALQQLA